MVIATSLLFKRNRKIIKFAEKPILFRAIKFLKVTPMSAKYEVVTEQS